MYTYIYIYITTCINFCIYIVAHVILVNREHSRSTSRLSPLTVASPYASAVRVLCHLRTCLCCATHAHYIYAGT